jgi:hypothetical protein
MNDTDTTREQRIAAIEADQQRRHAEGGTIEERIARLNELGDKIAADAPADDADAPQ